MTAPSTKKRMTFEAYLHHDNEERDYWFKRSEYAARGVLEYWVIDPIARKITVFTLIAGFYEEAIYIGEQMIQSQIEALQLTTEQILNRKLRATEL